MPVKPVKETEFKAQRSFITLEKNNATAEMTRDQSMLMDSAPLFLPTRWSTSGTRHVEYTDSQSDMFESFSPEITLNADRMKPPATDVPVDKNAVSAKVDAHSTFLIGRSGDASGKQVMNARSAFYEVHAAQDGKLIMTGTIQNPIPEAGDLLWQPAEFWVRVVQEGVMGSPLLTSGSGNDSLDAALRNIVSSEKKIALLPPGYYRVVIGP
jgi:hypothetical protein